MRGGKCIPRRQKIGKCFWLSIYLLSIPVFGQADTLAQKSYIVLNNGKILNGNVKVQSNLFSTNILLNDTTKMNIQQVRLINNGNTKYANVFCGFLPSFHLADRIKNKDSIDFFKLLVIYNINGMPFAWTHHYYFSINDNKVAPVKYSNLKKIIKDNDNCINYLKSNQTMVTTSWLLILGGYLTMGIGIYQVVTDKSLDPEPSISPVILIGSGSVLSGFVCGLIAPRYLKKAINSY